MLGFWFFWHRAVHPSMPTPHALQRLLARRRHALAEHLVPALGGDVDAVHQARVASRRLREAVPVAGAALPPDRVRRARRRIRRLTRALGPVRELDVALHMVEELAGRQDAAADALARIRTLLEREQDARRAFLAHRVDEAKARRLLARLEQLEAAVPPPELATDWRDELVERIRDRARALHSAINDAGALFSPDRLHQVRIAVKKLRYGLELAGDARVAATGRAVRQLKEIQETLGRLHDVDVLLTYVHSLRAAAGAAPELIADLDTLERVLTSESRQLHAGYLRRQPGLIRLTDRVLDTTVPRIEQAPLVTASLRGVTVAKNLSAAPRRT
jgi:CHAD domain-containing protein